MARRRASCHAVPPMDQSRTLSVTEHVPDDPSSATPVLVLVHGSLDRAGSFARVLRRLRDLHTLAYDRRGYHHSRHLLPVHTTLGGHVDDLLTVIDDRPAVVVGHSYGGIIALDAALRPGGPGPILAIAAYEPPLPWLASRSQGPGDPGRRTERRGPQDTGDPGERAERFFRRMVGDSAWERLPDAAKADRRADGAALAAETDAIRVTEAPFDVAALTVPTTYGRGSNSLPHHRQAVDWLVAHTPAARLVEIAGAGHGAHLTHPDAFATMARETVASGGAPGVAPAGRGHRDYADQDPKGPSADAKGIPP